MFEFYLRTLRIYMDLICYVMFHYDLTLVNCVLSFTATKKRVEDEDDMRMLASWAT